MLKKMEYGSSLVLKCLFLDKINTNIEINENQVYNNVINNNKILTSGFLCVKIINALFKGEGL